MGDTPSAENNNNNSNLPHISDSRDDSTAEFRIMNALTHLVPALAAYTIQPLQVGALKMLVNWSK